MITFDRFACHYNTMRLRRIGHQRITGLSYLPHSLVKCWVMSDCKAVGSFIVTMWKSAYFPPLLCGDDAHFNFFVRDWLFLSLCFNKSNLFIKGKAKNKLFGTKAFKSRCLALRIDFAGNNFRSSLRSVFVPPLMAIVWLASLVYPEVSMVFPNRDSSKIVLKFTFLDWISSMFVVSI